MLVFRGWITLLGLPSQSAPDWVAETIGIYFLAVLKPRRGWGWFLLRSLFLAGRRSPSCHIQRKISGVFLLLEEDQSYRTSTLSLSYLTLISSLRALFQIQSH